MKGLFLLIALAPAALIAQNLNVNVNPVAQGAWSNVMLNQSNVQVNRNTRVATVQVQQRVRSNYTVQRNPQQRVSNPPYRNTPPVQQRQVQPQSASVVNDRNEVEQVQFTENNAAEDNWVPAQDNNVGYGGLNNEMQVQVKLPVIEPLKIEKVELMPLEIVVPSVKVELAVSMPEFPKLNSSGNTAKKKQSSKRRKGSHYSQCGNSLALFSRNKRKGSSEEKEIGMLPCFTF